MEKEILLVKLPKIKEVDDSYYAIGYYTDSGFSFAVLTPQMIKLQPIRTLPFPKYSGDESYSDIEIIGNIKNLPKV